MTFVYFSYKDDAAALRQSVASLRAAAGEDVPVCVVNDAAAPIPAEALPVGVVSVMSRYDRGGTGKGLEAVRGQLHALREVMQATGEDYAVKIDSDIFVRDVSLLEVKRDGEPQADMLACEGARALLPMGCVYRVSRWAVAAALKLIEARDALGWQDGVYAEALTLWHLLALTPLRLRLIPQALGYLQGFYLTAAGELPVEVQQAGVVHCGEPHYECGQLVRASRELTRTRMLLLGK